MLQSPERDFTIKISGLEIYNENVRDLLNSESGRNLKLLDDPEVMASVKLTSFHRNDAGFNPPLSSFTRFCLFNLCLQKGTVVEKLVEETVSNDQHLRHLISICEGN